MPFSTINITNKSEYAVYSLYTGVASYTIQRGINTAIFCRKEILFAFVMVGWPYWDRGVHSCTTLHLSSRGARTQTMCDCVHTHMNIHTYITYLQSKTIALVKIVCTTLLRNTHIQQSYSFRSTRLRDYENYERSTLLGNLNKVLSKWIHLRYVL